MRTKSLWFNGEEGGPSEPRRMLGSRRGTHRTSWSSTSPAVSTPVLLLDLDGYGRENEIGDAKLFFSETKLIAQVIGHLPSHLNILLLKPCGDRRGTKVTGMGTLEVVSRGPAHKAAQAKGSLFTDRSSVGGRQPPLRLSSPF